MKFTSALIVFAIGLVSTPITMAQNGYQDALQNLPSMADGFSKILGEDFGVTLDYSGDSLKKVDEIIASDFSQRQILNSTVFGFAIYLGETIRRNLGAEWQTDEAKGYILKDIGKSDLTFAPLEYAHNRILNGDGPSFSAQYETIVAKLKAQQDAAANP